MLCSVMPYFVMVWCVMVCYAMLCSVLSCCVLSFFFEGEGAGYLGPSGTLGTTGGLAAAVCRVGVAGKSVLEI